MDQGSLSNYDGIRLPLRPAYDRRQDAEEKMLDSLKRLEMNGTGILKASSDDDPGRIVSKWSAMQRAMEDLQEALDLLWWRHECRWPSDSDDDHDGSTSRG